ncbi:ABC transporter ATP-binding protein [Thermococcus gammatolerans]|uniref:ABC-type transport system, ATPase component, putative multidrug transporter n=1 Tax=Thermococcus gammatolerans (strain DSM 15229 / JCM 11827 / EJ3) TaxID=593117 RepID=C5A6X7_THEGJ|nr:ABC transporter ATP-binding protein [Thermococcus gammatolerans]ACS33989.1 ABC-type transport system, ATPase component, putative multidrug transporter [Thermococcus gammatolerans EJ3]
MKYAIVAENLRKRYGNTVAVDGISFKVKRGEIFALLGPNGAGKTTTVRMLTTLTRIDEGNAYVNGFSVKSERRKVKESIGVVLDVSNLYEELTVEENLTFVAELYGAPRENVKKIIQEFNLPEKKKFGKLSSGFKRRVAIAAALVHDPPIVFMDEPTVALDVRSARALRELISSLNLRGRTIFLTTHNMEEAEKLPHRIAIINRGRIVAIGTRNELRKLIGARVKIRIKIEPLHSKLLTDLQEFRPRFDGEYLTFESEDVDEFMEKLLKLKGELGFKLLHVSTELPTIEEIFLELTEEVENGGTKSCGGCPVCG